MELVETTVLAQQALWWSTKGASGIFGNYSAFTVHNQQRHQCTSFASLLNFAEHTNHQKLVHGFVKFDHGPVEVPGLGTFYVKSEYPRLKPKFERKFVGDGDMEALCSNILTWVNEFFETNGREEYFKELVHSSVLFAVYVNPLAELYSDELDYCIKWSFWLWYNDDVMEEAIENKIIFKDLKVATDQFQSILQGKFDNNSARRRESVPNYPHFGQLFDALLQLHNAFKEHLPDYENRIKNYANDLQRYFGALRWFSINEIDGRHSEENFRTYRKALAHFDGIADLIALIHGVNLPDEIMKSLTMKRLLDVANSFGGFANDLLGMKKEFKNGQKDNLVVFLVMEKKIPMEAAVRRVCDFLTTELTDYELVRKVILREFDYDDDLFKYLDILDSLIDGYNVVHLLSRRHLCANSVTLTR